MNINKEKVLLCWSGGKDSAMALYELLRSNKYEVIALLTVLSDSNGRIPTHSTREKMLDLQAKSLGLRLEKIRLVRKASNKIYESRMKKILDKYKLRYDVEAVAFGDIFLEDLREYREKNLSKAGMKGLFPLWRKSTSRLAGRFIKLGFKAVINCVDTAALDKKFIYKPFDRKFLAGLPDSVDCCGENGEFHSFVYDGPIFRKKIRYKKGKVIFKEKRFCYCDLIPENGKCD